MNLYFAPLEGITGYIYRNAHQNYYKGIDKYFTPFISPNQNRALSSKEINDIKPEHNQGIYVVPQILTNNAEYFVRAAGELKERYGYNEVNLNLGCPSGTVAAKGKGAGFLGRKEALDEFLEEIYTYSTIKISVKTRIGVEDPEEFYDLLEIFNKYPIYELIIHPRVRNDYYNNMPNLKMFAESIRLVRCPAEYQNDKRTALLCYNGDIFTKEHYIGFEQKFPEIDKIMLGRGLLVNPALAEQIKSNNINQADLEEDIRRLRAFHDRLYAGYREILSGDCNVLFKMKELWFYMSHSFTCGEKYLKKIRKANRLNDYEEVIHRLFAEQEGEIYNA